MLPDLGVGETAGEQFQTSLSRSVSSANRSRRTDSVAFELLELDTERPEPGSSARVRGQLAGQNVEFAVNVLELSRDRLALVADGPISLDVEYAVRRSVTGGDIRASISMKGHGILGRLLAKATEALLAAGALQSSMNRLAREPQIALTA